MDKISVIYEDASLLVLDKPAGLVVDESATHQGETLEAVMKMQGIALERGGIVHRLDKDTSGLLLVAKTQGALENLQIQFAQRKVKKEYTALVHGFIEKSGVVAEAIERNPLKREKFTVSEEGKEAQTEYKPIKNLQFTIGNLQKIFQDLSEQSYLKGYHPLNKIQIRKLERMHYNQFTLLRCLPKTGRTHQIRVHLKYIGYPIVSDEKYGGRKIVRLDQRWCPRQFLHAARIEFAHPVGGRWMVMESPLAEDLNNALQLLDSYITCYG